MHVILIHGQARTNVSLALLGGRLRRQGHEPHYVSYFAFRDCFEKIVRDFVTTARQIGRDEPYAIVGHSLGSIVARASLPALADMPPRHLVMLAPPNHPPRLARFFRNNPIYRLATNDCGQKLADPAFFAALPTPTVPTTIIAGTAGPRGRFSPFGDRPNDLIVSVDETCLGREHGVVLVPYLHMVIMNSSEVARIINGVLANSAAPADHRV